MHLRPRAITPGIPLVSISVSFVALRLLSWAEPKVLPGKSGDASAFVGPSLRDQLHHSRSKGLRLLPWAQAVPLDVPMAQRAPPSVMDDLRKRDANVASRTSGEGPTIEWSNLPRKIVREKRLFFRGHGDSSLWRDCQLEAMRSLHHPWTLGLATGTTSRRSFQQYVAQDAYFLRAFAKAYAYALTKVEDEGDVRAFHSLIGSVLDELGLHASYAAKWGLDIHNIPPPLKATSEYVNFLLAVASDPGSSAAQVLASMAPCMRLYAFLGKALKHAFPLWRESIYAEWIETYSSEEFETAAVLVETLLDAHSAEAEYPSLLTLYRKAMELEYAFFAAQSQGTAEDDRPHHLTQDDSIGSVQISSGGSATFQPGAKLDRASGVFSGVQHRVALLCVDFDDTLTDGDTTSLLVKTAKGQRGTPAGQAEVDREWKVLTSLFLTKWNEVTEESLAAKLAEGTGAENQSGAVDRKGLEAMLQKLQTVDLDSVSRVSDSKVLEGVTRESVHATLAGPLRSSWKVRPGMARCFSRALASSFRTHVVSINWSRDVITGVLSDTLAGDGGSYPSARVDGGCGFSAASNNLLGEMKLPGFGGDWPAPVTSNDLLYDEHGVSTGEITMKVPGSFGKHQHFLNLAAKARETAGGFEAIPKTMTIYVGDSVTDLLAMLDADVGIVVGTSDGDAFERVASAFGVPIRPLAAAYGALGEAGGEADSLEEGSTGHGSCVYRASGWAEIDVFLFGDVHH